MENPQTIFKIENFNIVQYYFVAVNPVNDKYMVYLKRQGHDLKNIYQKDIGKVYFKTKLEALIELQNLLKRKLDNTTNRIVTECNK